MLLKSIQVIQYDTGFVVVGAPHVKSLDDALMEVTRRGRFVALTTAYVPAGLNPPRILHTIVYAAASDIPDESFDAWLAACSTRTPELKTKEHDVWVSFSGWFAANYPGVRIRKVSFNRAMKSRGFLLEKTKGRRYWVGITIGGGP